MGEDSITLINKIFLDHMGNPIFLLRIWIFSSFKSDSLVYNGWVFEVQQSVVTDSSIFGIHY